MLIIFFKRDECCEVLSCWSRGPFLGVLGFTGIFVCFRCGSFRGGLGVV